MMAREVLNMTNQNYQTQEISVHSFQDIIDNIHEGIAITSMDHIFLFSNPAADKIFGVQQGTLLGRDLREFLEDNEFVKIKAGTMRRLKGETDAYDFTIVRADGDKRVINVTASPYQMEGEVAGGLGVYRDITEQRQIEEKIHYLTFHDSLTDLYNRAYFEQEIQRIDTDRQMPVSVIMIDLNSLKLINDTYGHDYGDQMLITTAKVLKQSCRSEDVIARVGGDEFVVLLPQTAMEKAMTVQNRIETESRKVTIEDLPISLAVGVATKHSQQELFSDVLKKAEDIMYQNKLRYSQDTKNNLLKALFAKLGYNSYETEEHTWRMQKLAFLMGEKMKLSEEELEQLGNLISLHDIGKTKVPLKILKKEQSLTPSEWALIKKHPETGYRIALSMEEFSNVANSIFAHHERFDGSGYPRNLRGKKIPLLSRITSIVDAYEVMTSGRPYQKAVPKEAALAEIKYYAGTQFDPELVDIFLSIMRKKEA